ncbi:hypothetical protein FACS1894201_04260 [Bacteroidia bacterium]|nr:hypothetical protein FACS1894201_04260 [Bacteroidia bacterium]
MLVTPDCMITVLTDDLTEYHGTADVDDQFPIAPVPLIVKVSLLRVAVTSVEIGVPMSQVWAKALMESAIAIIVNSFFMIIGLG